MNSKLVLFIIALLLAISVYSQKKKANNPTKILNTISLTISIKNPSCSDAIGIGGAVSGNGIINLTASGGLAPYIYVLTNATIPQNNGYFPGLNAGVYFIRVTDAAGTFLDTSAILVNTLSEMYATVQVNKLPTTCTSSDGSLTIVGSGGTPPYTYSIDGGITFTSTNTFNNLTQGFYNVYAKDANGCIGEGGTSHVTSLYTFFFSNQCNFYIEPGGMFTACSNDGTAFVWGVNGKPPYQYSLDGVNYQTVNYSNNYTYDPYEYAYSNLPAGLYHVYGKDSAGAATITAFTISKSCYVAISYVGIDASCQKNDGSITVIAKYGTPPYTYTIDGINYQTSNVFTGLGAGSYSVTVSDVNGETYSRQVTVFDKCPTVTATETDVHCNQKDGAITATGSKGTTPYQFSIDGITFQSSNVFSNLNAGNYEVYIRDAGGFEDSTSVTVYNNCIQISLLVTNTTCSNKNGSITINASNGTAPYQYSIDGVNYQTNNSFNALAAGTYSVTVMDANGVKKDSTIAIADASPPKINTTITSAGCDGKNGSINISATGGTAPLQFSVDNGNTYQSANSFNSLDSGQYFIAVQDANNCMSRDTITITAPPTPVVSLGNDTMLCNGEKVLLQVPFNNNYQYLWQDNSKTNQFTVTTPGNYFVKVTNQFNCFASDTINVKYYSVPYFSLGNDTTGCDGKAFMLQPVPTITGTYLWNDGSTGASLNVLSAGMYWLQVSDSGCAARDTILVTFKPSPSINLGNDTTLCEDQTLILNATNPNSTYLWQDGSTLPTFLVTASGMYSVRVDENGCDTSGQITIEYQLKPQVALVADTTLCNSESFKLNAYYPNSTYLWQDGSTLAYYNVTTGGTYTVNVNNICGDTSATTIVTLKNCVCKFYVPTAFTPNGDGINDVFRPGDYDCQISNYEMKIYNRWGQLVFDSKNTGTGWDGNYKNQQEPVDIYIWVMEYKDNLTGRNLHKTGSVMLIR